MRLAFNEVARILLEGGILTGQLLVSEIPLLAWDAAIAAGWYRLASETRKDIFPEQLGHYWVWRDESRDWQGLFRSETAEWHARLLEVPEPAPESEVNEPRKSASPVRKPVRRSARNERIDSALQKIAEMRPRNHREVFKALEGRVGPPEAEPFGTARGWLAGFQKNPHGARSWLSKAWARLELPPFRRGPK